MVNNTILSPLFIHLPLIFHRLLLDLICLLLREVGSQQTNGCCHNVVATLSFGSENVGL